MVLHNCTTIDDKKFSEPMPWIGLYIAAASLLCSLLMGIDTFNGFRRRKLWFPCRFFSLNAASLTLLSIATKLTVDLNTTMCRKQDQLTKLSGTVLICTVMSNFMNSLGSMDDFEMISNVVALGILVITVTTNIGIQMRTGVICALIPEHAIIMSFMLVLLVILCSTAIMVPTAKKLLEKQYDDIYKQTSSERTDLKKLREDVKKHWMMAHTCSPQYVVGRSATSTAAGFFCLISALILLQASLNSIFIYPSNFSGDESDYKWSTTLVLISQAIAVGVGTIAPVIRWFNDVNYRSPKGRKWSFIDKFKVEKYWVQRLVEWKESPLPFHISNRRFRKMFHVSKIQILNVLILMQYGVVLGSKLIRLASILLNRFCCCCCCCCRCCNCCSCCCKRRRWKDNDSNLESSSYVELGRFVLHLDGDKDSVQMIMKHVHEDSEHWIRRGRNNRQNSLMDLLEKSTVSLGFQEVEFDLDLVPSIGTERRLPKCWALNVVTLTSIAISIAILNNKKDITKLLRRGVDEGLKYVRLIEKKLDTKELIKMREVADIVWQGIAIYDHWLDEDLKKLAHEEKNADKILEKLAHIGKDNVSQFMTGREKDEDSRDWPAKVLAADTMYKVCQTILLKRLGTDERLLEWLQKSIADILGASFTELTHVISMECFQCPIELREERIREAAYLLGEAEEILKKQESSRRPDTQSSADIDQINHSSLPSASSSNDISINVAC